MATVRGFLNEIESICECNICCIEYDEEKHVPRVPPCQHTVCTDCLIKHCKRHKLKCPFCNHEHNLRNGDVKVFPKDNTRRDLKELLGKFSQSLCSVCQQHDHVKYFCATCKIRLCRECYKKRKTRLCKTHNVDTINDSQGTPDTSLESTENHPQSICLLTGHENNELKFFCSENSCSTPVCANCIVESHRTHDIRSVKEEYKNRTNCMQRNCQRTREKIASAKSLLVTIKREYASIKEERTKLATDAIRGKKYIKAQRIIQTNLSMLERRKEQLQYFIENATECCAISDEALTGNNFVAFLSVEKTLKEKLESFQQSDVDKPLDLKSKDDFHFQIDFVHLKEKLNRMIGFVSKTIRDQGFPRFLVNKCERPSLGTVVYAIFMAVLLALWLYPLPYTSVFETDNSYSAFSDKQASPMCYSEDGMLTPNLGILDKKQTCGNSQNSDIYGGAYTNASLLYRKSDYIMIQVHVAQIKGLYPGQILFEFGISKGYVGHGSILGLSSLDYHGWVLILLNENQEFALLNMKLQIIYQGSLSITASYTFRIGLNPNKIISLKIENTILNIYEILDETKLRIGNPKQGFVKLCKPTDAHVTARILNNDVAFNKSTLHSNLFISANDKKISNVKLPSFFKKQMAEESIYHDVMLLNCTKNCVYVTEFRVRTSQRSKVFSVILTNSQYLPSANYNMTLLSYIPCIVTNIFKSESFCLSLHPFFTVNMIPNVWHQLIIIVNREHHSASFLFGQYRMNIQNSAIFERGTPILRWIMEDMGARVDIRLGDKEEFDILTWFSYIVLSYANELLSKLPFPPAYLGLLISISILLKDFVNGYVIQNEPIVRRGRRRRNI